MKVLIFGLGILGGGFASASFFLDQGDEVRITDLRSETVLGGPLAILKHRGALAICQEHREEDFLWADMVIKNPAVPNTNPYLALAKRVETDMSYLLASPFLKNIQIIAITGTKGKTTTAAAISHVLNSNDRESLQCGNMGISGFSVLAELQKRTNEGGSLPSYLVCELSSWQIRDIHASMRESLPEFRLVILTSLFPDHLNTYTDFNEYKKDKWLLLTSKSKQVIISKENLVEVKETTKILTNRLFAIEDVPGANKVEARLKPAWAACRKLGFTSKAIIAAFDSFRGVPHRQEQIGVLHNIMFINDSSATIPEAVAFSCGSCPWQYTLICGGTDKNLAADAMKAALAEAAAVFILDGSFTRNKLIPLLEKAGIPFHGPLNSMKEAVEQAFIFTQDYQQKQGSTQPFAIILSPGAASFGMFKHEFDRGDQFKENVMGIIKAEGLELDLG